MTMTEESVLHDTALDLSDFRRMYSATGDNDFFPSRPQCWRRPEDFRHALNELKRQIRDFRRYTRELENLVNDADNVWDRFERAQHAFENIEADIALIQQHRAMQWPQGATYAPLNTPTGVPINVMTGAQDRKIRPTFNDQHCEPSPNVGGARPSGSAPQYVLPLLRSCLQPFLATNHSASRMTQLGERVRLLMGLSEEMFHCAQRCAAALLSAAAYAIMQREATGSARYGLGEHRLFALDAADTRLEMLRQLNRMRCRVYQHDQRPDAFLPGPAEFAARRGSLTRRWHHDLERAVNTINVALPRPFEAAYQLVAPAGVACQPLQPRLKVRHEVRRAEFEDVLSLMSSLAAASGLCEDIEPSEINAYVSDVSSYLIDECAEAHAAFRKRLRRAHRPITTGSVVRRARLRAARNYIDDPHESALVTPIATVMYAMTYVHYGVLSDSLYTAPARPEGSE